MRKPRILLLAMGTLLSVSLAAQAVDPDNVVGDDDGGFFEDGLVPAVAITTVGGLVAGAFLYYFYVGTGGLRHVDKQNVLEHPLRRSLMTMVQDQPGIHLRELASAHGTAVTNTQWHLRKLELAELLRTQKVQGRRLYYPAEGGVEARSQAIQNAAVRNPNAEAIFEYLNENSGCNQRTLADDLEMNPGTVRWHLRKLEAAGLIRSVPDGTQTRYFTLQRPPRPTRRRADADVEETASHEKVRVEQE